MDPNRHFLEVKIEQTCNLIKKSKSKEQKEHLESILTRFEKELSEYKEKIKGNK